MTCQIHEKLCPLCCEVIKKEAIRCKHCQADLSGRETPGADYSTSGAASGITLGGYGHHIEGGVHITTLSELEEIDPDSKAELFAQYEQKIRDHPENARCHFALGLSYLDRRLYHRAAVSLQKALGKGLHEADLYYYLALALLGGRQPRCIGLSRIRQIEALLEAAVRLDPGKPHFQVLWALVKYDYYLSSGLRVPPPSVEEILAQASNHPPDTSELLMIARHVPLPDSPMTRTLLVRV